MLIETDLLAEFIEQASSAETDWKAACAHCRSLPPDEFHDNQAEHTTVMRLHRENRTRGDYHAFWSEKVAAKV